MGSGFAERLGWMRKHLRAVSLADALDMRVLAFALGLAWSYVVFFSTTIHFSTRNDISHFNSVFGFSSVGMLVVLVMAAFWPLVFGRTMRGRAVCWIAPAMMSLSTVVLVIVDLDVIRQPWCSIASTAAGSGLAVMYLAWGSVFKGLAPARAVVKTASSFLLAALLFALIVALPRAVGVAVTIVLPLVVGFVLFSMLRIWNELPVYTPRRVSRVAFSIRAVLSLGVISFAESLMRSLLFNASPIISEGSYPWLFLVATIISLGIVVAPLFTAEALDFGTAYKASVFMLAFVFLLLPILDRGSFAADLLALVIYSAVMLIVWTVLVQITNLYNLSVLFAFGIGWGAHVAGSLAGTFGGALLGSYAELSSRMLSILALVCACLLFFAYLFLFTEKFMIRLTGGEAGEGSRMRRGGRKPFHDRCDEIERVFGLTPREKEILVLIAKGRSTPRICATLGLTSGTANTHLSHLYKKLDVHDRQELIDLVDRSGEG